jgi:predicted nucleic acid-binding protein
VLPAKAAADALHLAIAAAHRVDYLLTWNIRHLANAAIRRQVERITVEAGLVAPVLCTPEELMEG